MILVDSSVWIEADRRKTSTEAQELGDLLARDEVATTDIVVAELMQGAATEEKLNQLERTLNALHFFHASRQDWLRAGQTSFRLRRQGLATPLSDVLIATIALSNDLQVYAIDSDFERVPGLALYKARRT